MHGLVAAEPLEHLGEERVFVPVVERDVGRGPHDDEHAGRVDPVEHLPVGLEVGEVVLLLESWVPDELRRRRPEALQALRRHGVRKDHARRGAEAELVLQRRELVVVRRRAGDPEAARGEHHLVRAVREREVEAAALREAAQRRQPAGHRPGLADHAAAPVRRADDPMLDPVPLQQLERLRELSRRHLDLVPVLGEQPEQRPEERHVRRVRDVDPDAHRTLKPMPLPPMERPWLSPLSSYACPR